MISLKDYENLDGFGLSTYEQVAELNKALAAGYDIPATTGGVSGSSLRVESLEASLKIITFQMSHIKFWQKIPKLPAYSTVEEYNRLTSYGSEGGAFTPEGELGEYDDATYSRQVSLVKYLQTVRKVTHPMTLVRTAHGDVIGNEVRNGIMWILGKLENYLFNGDNSLRYNFPTNEGYEFAGLKKLIDSTMVVDAGGDPLSEDILETASNLIVENYGLPTDIFIGTKPLADLAKVMFPKERIVVPFKEGQIGVPINTFASQAGLLSFNPDVFLRRKYVIPGTTGATSTKAPVAPKASNLTTASPTGSDGDFTKTNNGLGTYYWTATMNNRYGESAPYTSDSGCLETISTATNHVVVTITNASTIGSYPPEWVNIYRTMAGGAATDPHYLIGQQASSSQTGDATQTTFTDTNSIAAGCHDVYLGELNPQIIVFKQLAPMMKMDLAVVEPSIRWLQLLYGVPQLYAPKKWIRIKNVGEATV
jgi:hypothetical protein